jgi:hypothetical protein
MQSCRFCINCTRMLHCRKTGFVIAENGRSRKIAFVHHLEWL